MSAAITGLIYTSDQDAVCQITTETCTMMTKTAGMNCGDLSECTILLLLWMILQVWRFNLSLKLFKIRRQFSVTCMCHLIPATHKQQAAVTPILKKPSADPNNYSNLCPISNFSLISRILEKIVASQVHDHFTNNIMNCFNLVSAQLLDTSC